MTVPELLRQEHYLVPTTDKTKVYIIPSGNFGYIAYPVGTYDSNKQFIPYDNAVAITPDEYISLKEHKSCWSNNELIAHIKPIELVTAEELIITFESLDSKEDTARAYLSKYDYIGSKVANAVLMNNAGLLEQYRVKYADILPKLEEARDTINKIEEQRETSREEYLNAKDFIQAYYSQ